VVVDAYTDSLTSPAKKAGIEPGDVIVALDGQPIEDVPQLQQKVGFKKPGDAVEVTLLRQGGVKKTVTVRLAKAPGETEAEVATASRRNPNDASAKEEKLGIAVEPLTQDDARDPKLRPVLQRGGGLVVTDVSPDGPAFQRLSTAEDGGPDIIIAVNGQPTRTRAALRDALAKVKAGEVVTLQVLSRSPDGWVGRVVRLRAR
jgi:serine protease Do